MNCLICDYEPLARRDFDGFCLACRAGVADGLYRIEWVTAPVQSEPFAAVELGRYRAIVFATCAEHPLGTEFPYHVDPVRYEPEMVRAHWRRLDREEADRGRAETVLNSVTTWG